MVVVVVGRHSINALPHSYPLTHSHTRTLTLTTWRVGMNKSLQKARWGEDPVAREEKAEKWMWNRKRRHAVDKVTVRWQDTKQVLLVGGWATPPSQACALSLHSFCSWRYFTNLNVCDLSGSLVWFSSVSRSCMFHFKVSLFVQRQQSPQKCPSQVCQGFSASALPLWWFISSLSCA